MPFSDDHPSSQVGAERLAKTIRDYWRGQGFNGIRTSLVEIRVDAGASSYLFGYGVRSNIGPTGYPPREIGADA